MGPMENQLTSPLKGGICWLAVQGFQNEPVPDTSHWLLQELVQVTFCYRVDINTQFCFTNVIMI